MGRLNIVCVKWGTKYKAHYVNVLYDMVKRNMNDEFNFICFTDDSTDINPDIEIRDLPEGVEGWWNKLYLFKKGLLDGSVLYLD